jgi:hypothetical protein
VCCLQVTSPARRPRPPSRSWPRACCRAPPCPPSWCPASRGTCTSCTGAPPKSSSSSSSSNSSSSSRGRPRLGRPARPPQAAQQQGTALAPPAPGPGRRACSATLLRCWRPAGAPPSSAGAAAGRTLARGRGWTQQVGTGAPLVPACCAHTLRPCWGTALQVPARAGWLAGWLARQPLMLRPYQAD